jgi:hypothetical protein
MKLPFRSEEAALDNKRRMNTRRGKGPTRQVAYPCPLCEAEGFPTVWHLRTERPIEGKIAKVVQLRAGRKPRHRPAAQVWRDEDNEGQWAA